MKKVIDWFKEFWFVWFFLLLFYVILRVSGYDIKIVEREKNEIEIQTQQLVVDTTETTKDSIQTEVEGERQEIDIEIEKAVRILDSLEQTTDIELVPLPSRRN